MMVPTVTPHVLCHTAPPIGKKHLKRLLNYIVDKKYPFLSLSRLQILYHDEIYCGWKKKICTPALKYFDDCVFWTMHNIVCVIWCLFLFFLSWRAWQSFLEQTRVQRVKSVICPSLSGLMKVARHWCGEKGWLSLSRCFSDCSTRHIERIPSSLFWLIRLREELSLDQYKDVSPFSESRTERYFVSHRLDLNQDTALVFVPVSSSVIAHLIGLFSQITIAGGSR